MTRSASKGAGIEGRIAKKHNSCRLRSFRIFERHKCSDHFVGARTRLHVIRGMCRENHTRTTHHGELLTLPIDFSETSVSNATT